MGGQKCPWCVLETATTRAEWPESESPNAKAILKAQRDARRAELKEEKTLREKVNRLMQFDKANVSKTKKYSPRGRRALRAQQGIWLAEQLEKVLSWFEPTTFGDYEIYLDTVQENAVYIRTLKKELPKIQRTYYRKARADGTNRRHKVKDGAFLFSPFDWAGDSTGRESASVSNENRHIHSSSFD